MKKAYVIAAALGLLALPALAQQTPTGQSAGGPGRAGIPGQVGGGVPGTQPNMGAPRRMGRKMMRRPKMHRRMMKKRMR